jgi:hypothetical protein
VTSNEKSAILLIIVALLAIFMLAGCGRNDQLRGHNANMQLDAVQAVTKTLKKAAPRLYAEHPTLKRDLDDIEDRTELSRKDHPWHGAEIKRSTPEKPSQKDIDLYNAYTAVVDREDAKRKEHAEKWAWWYWLWWWVKAALYASPFIGLLWLFLYFRRRFFQFGEVQVKHIAATVKDKDERQAIAGGSPTERIFKKIKGALAFWKTGPQDAPTRTQSEPGVVVVPDQDSAHESGNG